MRDPQQASGSGHVAALILGIIIALTGLILAGGGIWLAVLGGLSII